MSCAVPASGVVPPTRPRPDRRPASGSSTTSQGTPRRTLCHLGGLGSTVQGVDRPGIDGRMRRPRQGDLAVLVRLRCAVHRVRTELHRGRGAVHRPGRTQIGDTMAPPEVLRQRPTTRSTTAKARASSAPWCRRSRRRPHCDSSRSSRSGGHLSALGLRRHRGISRMPRLRCRRPSRMPRRLTAGP